MYRLNEAMVMAASVMIGSTNARGSVNTAQADASLGGDTGNQWRSKAEEDDQERAQQERGHGVEDEGQAGQGVVGDRVAPDDLQDTERYGDDQGHHGGRPHQHERLWQPLPDDRR